MVVPAVAQEDADGVVARLQLGGDVVGDVEVAAVEACVERVEAVVADAAAVDVQLVESGGGDVGAGPEDGFGCAEGLAEVGGGSVVYVVSVIYPGALPGVCLHQSGLEAGCL